MPKQPPEKILFVITAEDKPYLAKVSPLLKGVPAKVYNAKLETLAQLELAAKKFGAKHIITTNIEVLKRLLPLEAQKTAKINNYAGSIIPHKDIEYLIINPLRQLVSIPYGEFITRTHISKIVRPQNWRDTSEFNWKVIDKSSDYNEAMEWLSACDLIGEDIETIRNNCAIRCIAFAGVKIKENVSKTFVLPIRNMQDLEYCRQLNKIRVPKVFQGGNYDIAYLSRFNSVPYEYYFDTANMMHAWYAELPKDLGYLTAFLVRDSMYWKDLSNTNDLMEYYRYNALDAWGTVEAAISWLLTAPDWAIQNYKIKFPQNTIAHVCEMTGIKRDPKLMREAAQGYLDRQEEILTSLQNATGHENFNPSSPKQVLKLLHVLSYKSAKDSSAATLEEGVTKHPLLEWFCSRIIEYRELRKLSSTYFIEGEKAKEYKGRFLYKLSATGTDSGRYASSEHPFWCGANIQNQPVESKATFVADEGFDIWEADYSQAEDRGVAYKSGDPNLLDIFAGIQDSHSVKASMFFGVPYEEIYSDELGKVIDKPLRDLSKRVNHGANYNMGASVLLSTMGSQKVRYAQKTLGLNPKWDLLKVCAELLRLYEVAFIRVKTVYYNRIKRDIKENKKLVGDLGWTRYCFGDPGKSKPALNAYVAHVTQSLNAMILDRALLKIFNALVFHPDFKLCAQVHDSIVFQIRKGNDELAQQVKELMEFPVDITDCKGITREMLVPVDLTKCGHTWKES